MNRTSRLVVVATVAAVLSWAAGFARADTALRLDLEGLVARAEVIVEGRVLAARGRLEPGGMITTEYEISVDRTFLDAASPDGPPAPTRRVRIPGGVLPDGRGMVLAGIPRLAVGEDVVLFLTRESRAGIRVPVGAAQGACFVHQDEDGRRFVSRRLRGLDRVGPGGGGSATGDAEPGEAPERAYEAWAAAVEATVAARLERERAARAPDAGDGR